jgi:hypothetical protein
MSQQYLIRELFNKLVLKIIFGVTVYQITCRHVTNRSAPKCHHIENLESDKLNFDQYFKTQPPVEHKYQTEG